MCRFTFQEFYQKGGKTHRTHPHPQHIYNMCALKIVEFVAIVSQNLDNINWGRVYYVCRSPDQLPIEYHPLHLYRFLDCTQIIDHQTCKKNLLLNRTYSV